MTTDQQILEELKKINSKLDKTNDVLEQIHDSVTCTENLENAIDHLTDQVKKIHNYVQN